MKRISILIFTFLIIISCSSEYIPRIIENIEIQEFKIDSTNIRAIQGTNSETIYYVGSKGDFGFTAAPGIMESAVFSQVMAGPSGEYYNYFDASLDTFSIGVMPLGLEKH